MSIRHLVLNGVLKCVRNSFVEYMGSISAYTIGDDGMIAMVSKWILAINVTIYG